MTHSNNIFYRLAQVIRWAGMLLCFVSFIFMAGFWFNGHLAFWQALLGQAIVGGLTMCVTSALSDILAGKVQV